MIVVGVFIEYPLHYLAESMFLIWFPLVYARSYKMKVNGGYLLTDF